MVVVVVVCYMFEIVYLLVSAVMRITDLYNCTVVDTFEMSCDYFLV